MSNNNIVTDYCEVSNDIYNVMLIIVQKYVNGDVMGMYVYTLKSVICIDDITVRVVENSLFSITIDLTRIVMLSVYNVTSVLV